MIKRCFLFFALALMIFGCLALVSCGGSKEPKPGPNEVTITFKVGGEKIKQFVEKGTVPVFEGSTVRPSGNENVTYRFTGWDKEFAVATENATYVAQYETVPLVTYQVRWILENGSTTTTVKENDTPVPPEVDAEMLTNSYIKTFTGWSNPIAPLTKEVASSASGLVYVAQYSTAVRYYTVRFMVDGVEYASTKTTYNELPTLPETEPSKAGYSSFYWVGSDVPVTADGTVCQALFAKSDAELLLWALHDTARLTFSHDDPEWDRWDNGEEIMRATNAILYLTTELRHIDESHYFYSIYADRVAAQLKYLLAPENNATPMFDLKANWPYCNLTATILLCKNTPAVWDRLTSEEKSGYDFMMKCFAYILTFGTDDNNSYNSGPRLDGNYSKGYNPNYRLANVAPMIFIAEYFGGADEVDEILLDYDFDDVIAEMQARGFMRAYNTWITEATVQGKQSFREASMNGGNLNGGGGGAGVRTEYTYMRYTLDEPEEIIRELFEYNYSGGKVISEMRKSSLEAYIVGGLTSPYQGQLGMMLELGKSDRSSAEYCMLDFVMVISILMVTEELDMYDPLDAENLDLFALVWVGNQDLMYKYEKGYMSYGNGKSQGIIKESEARGYMFMKAWWNDRYGDPTYTLFFPYGS